MLGATVAPINDESAEWTGVFAVAAELSRLGWRVALTLGKTQTYDLLAINPGSGRKVSIDVKSNWMTTREGRPKAHHWLCSNLLKGEERGDPGHFVIFVWVDRKLNASNRYFIVPGAIALDRLRKNVEFEKAQGHAQMTQYRIHDSPRTNPQAQHVGDFEGRWEVIA